MNTITINFTCIAIAIAIAFAFYFIFNLYFKIIIQHLNILITVWISIEFFS